MKKSFLIAALTFVGTTVFAQDAVQTTNSDGDMHKAKGKKLEVKSATSALETASAENGKSLWKPIAPKAKPVKMKSGKLDLKTKLK